MSAGSFKLQRSIGAKLSPSAEIRRDIVLKAIPRIEEYYAKLKGSRLPELDDLKPAARKAALKLYNKAVADGRFVDLLRTDPKSAAEKLGVKVDLDHWKAIQSIADKFRNPGGPVEGPIEAVIAVAVVIACAKPSEGVVIDESGMITAKL